MRLQFPRRQLGHDALPLRLAARGFRHFLKHAVVGVRYPLTSSLRFCRHRWYRLVLKAVLLVRQ